MLCKEAIFSLQIIIIMIVYLKKAHQPCSKIKTLNTENKNKNAIMYLTK